jgi:5-deoxy-D-glucuronate isomerase
MREIPTAIMAQIIKNVVTDKNTRAALHNRRMVQCLNNEGQVLMSMEEVEKHGPVTSYRVAKHDSTA